MSAKRRYTDEYRANALLALAANGGNVHKTARQLGIPYMTLKQWYTRDRHPEATLMSESKKEEMADACERVAWKLLGSIEKDHEDAPLGQRSTAFGTIVDKMRLLREQSTVDVTSGGKPLEASRPIEDTVSRFAAAAAAVLDRGCAGLPPCDGDGEPLDTEPGQGQADGQAS